LMLIDRVENPASNATETRLIPVRLIEGETVTRCSEDG